MFDSYPRIRPACGEIEVMSKSWWALAGLTTPSLAAEYHNSKINYSMPQTRPTCPRLSSRKVGIRLRLDRQKSRTWTYLVVITSGANAACHKTLRAFVDLYLSTLRWLAISTKWQMPTTMAKLMNRMLSGNTFSGSRIATGAARVI